ncbi:MAG TPA: MerR family transcriptional regulator [Anaerolineales bacterium]|nr:MerR family transcriptional regulator [Anaerolineales bacterium]
MKLKIGEFARIGQVTVQTLRHYDEMGLLKPSKVDIGSGYRYYTIDQLPRLHRILALKDLGFSLEQIARLLEDDLPFAELRGMMRMKQNELRTQVQEQLDRLERLEARMRLIEQENQQLHYEVILKRVEPLRIASVRRIIPSYWEEGPLWTELFEQLQEAGITAGSPCLSLYHAGEPEIDAEVCAPVPADAKPVSGLSIRTLPAVETMASTIHQGSFAGLAGAYAELLKWVDAHGYRIVGPDREIYLRLPEEYSRQDGNAITEMQIPVCRIKDEKTS